MCVREREGGREEREGVGYLDKPKSLLQLGQLAVTLWTHTYSPYLESNVPFWSDLSFRVSLGPSS